MAIISTTASVFAENKTPKVVVVGAGLAGLTTAYRLQQKGMDVHVYEARNRVGGRILSATVCGHSAELGAQNIADGGKAENIHRFVGEFGLELLESKVSLNHSYFNGERLILVEQLSINRQFHPESLKAQLNDLGRRSKNMREVLDGFLEKDDPLYRSIAVRLAAFEGATIDNLSPLYVETLYYILLGGVASMHRGGAEEDYCIDLVRIKGGNALLPEKLAENLDGRLHLNAPLIKVEREEEGTYLLTFKGDLKVKADILVLAIPCSVYDGIIFDENVLPEERLEAIKNVRYGTNAKIIVPFPESPPKRMAIINDHAISFFDADRSLLTLYFTGESGSFSKDNIIHTYSHERPMIELGFGDLCPPFTAPEFAKDLAFCAYEGPIGYSWPNDPFVKGSYSYIAPGQEIVMTTMKEEQGEVVKALFGPINQNIYFVGEHASILTEVSGTMEAACESGERAARMILNRL